MELGLDLFGEELKKLQISTNFSIIKKISSKCLVFFLHVFFNYSEILQEEYVLV